MSLKPISSLKMVFFYTIWVFLTVIYSFFSLLICWFPWQSRIPMIMNWNTVSLWLFKNFLNMDYVVSFNNVNDITNMKKHQDIHEKFRSLPQNMVVIGNHQSLWETIAFTPLFGRYFEFAFKKELLNVPFFGWTLRLLRMIKIDRQKGSDAFTHLTAQAKIRLTENRPVLMFPQGTRVAYGLSTTDEKYTKFKTGAARLAFELNVPILAIHHDAGKIWPKKGKPCSGLINVQVGPLFYPENYQNYQELHHAACGWLIEQDEESLK